MTDYQKGDIVYVEGVVVEQEHGSPFGVVVVNVPTDDQGTPVVIPEDFVFPNTLKDDLASDDLSDDPWGDPWETVRPSAGTGLPPGLLVTQDGTLLNWRGENYVLQSLASHPAFHLHDGQGANVAGPTLASVFKDSMKRIFHKKEKQ